VFFGILVHPVCFCLPFSFSISTPVASLSSVRLQRGQAATKEKRDSSLRNLFRISSQLINRSNVLEFYDNRLDYILGLLWYDTCACCISVKKIWCACASYESTKQIFLIFRFCFIFVVSCHLLYQTLVSVSPTGDSGLCELRTDLLPPRIWRERDFSPSLTCLMWTDTCFRT
jgi:hypothetical protein